MRQVLVALLVLIATGPAEGEELRVVTTLSTFKSLVEEVGGERVTVASVAAPQFNPHFIEPRPGDVLRVKRATLFVHAGLDLEAWRAPLVDAAGNAEIRPGSAGELDLSQGVTLLNAPQGVVTRALGDVHLQGNPHYWTSPENGLVMIRAIRQKLITLDPGGSEFYQARSEDLERELQTKIIGWKRDAQSIRGAEIVSYHDEWPYLMSFLGLKTTLFVEPKPGIPPSPRHLEELEQQMRARGIRVIVQSTFYPDVASATLAKRAGAEVVKLCQNVGELADCDSYLRMVDYNVRSLVAAHSR